MIYTGLYIPRYLKHGIKPNHQGSRLDKIIYGGDTETVRGKPNSIQFYSEDIACSDITFVSENTAAKQFIQWCESRKRNMQHVVYIHNLAFDLIEFLWGSHEKLVATGNEYEFNLYGWTVKGFYGTPTFCTVSKGHDRRIVLVDSFSFYRGSLASAARLFCPDLPKLQQPVQLGERRFTAKDAGFIAYAMRDAEVTYHIGRAIEEMHREFDLRQCISVADLAARIFRHHFLTYTIPQPSLDIVHAGLHSYHGGKNNLTVEPGIYEGATNVDISSAYPDAMYRMPAFSDATLYKQFKRTSKAIRCVPEYGVYLCSGRVANCAWPVMFSHGFKPLSGSVEETWIQGFELNEALRTGEFVPDSIRGYYYDAEQDITAPALRGFYDDFYQRKQTEPDKVRRFGYKLVCNSISGKFIQTRKHTVRATVDVDTGDVSDAAELIAGGMFHPFIASCITAHTRARIHKMEHHYKALHTATDGILTQQSARKSGEFRCVGNATKLGELEADTPSTVLLVRNKCYIKYQPDSYTPDKDAVKSKLLPGKYIGKYAMHGFQSKKVHDLERLIRTGERTYTVKKANRLKESIRQGLVPNDFVERTFTLRVPDIRLTPATGRKRERAV